MALDPDKYRLTEEDNQAIFEKIIRPVLFIDIVPSDKPVAVVFGGQPGAGKSAAIDDVVSELTQRGGALQIIGDDLRSYHPLHSELMVHDDKTAAFYTDRDTGRWIEKSINAAQELKVNLIIEGTMRDGNKVAETMQCLRTAGYEIDARGLAVNRELSELGILQRYEKQISRLGHGRMTTPEAHQAGYDGMLTTLERIEREKLADRVTIYRRGAEVIYNNEVKDGHWVNEPTARIAVENERNRPFSLDEMKEIVSNYKNVLELQEIRNAPRGEKEHSGSKINQWSKNLSDNLVQPDSSDIGIITGKEVQDRIMSKVMDLSMLINSPERVEHLLKVEKEKEQETDFYRPDSLKNTNVVQVVHGMIDDLKDHALKLNGLETVDFRVSKTDMFKTLNTEGFQQQIAQAQKLVPSLEMDKEIER